MALSSAVSVPGLRAVLLHLRLPLQVTLAPLFLWGVFAAGGRWSAATLLGFAAVHIFLYGGTTLFNSCYDRDEGPIAGLARPPGLPAWALPFSLAWQLIGGVAALLVGPAFAALYLLYAIVAALYSHPRVRLKARPLLSATLIFAVQGLGGVMAGALAGTGGHPPLADARFWLLALPAAATTLGLYPLTQVYQREEDAARGDRTLAMILGARGSFVFSAALLCAAGLSGLWALWALERPASGLLLLAGYGALCAAVIAIGHGYARLPVLANYRRLLRLQVVATAALAVFVLLQYLQPR